MSDFDHLRISVSDINLATSYFSPESVISVGRYDKVYKAEMHTYDKKYTVSLKRFDQSISSEWFVETIKNFSRFLHPNINSLLGFCDEGDEKILFFQHPEYGSLQNYVDNTRLTWTARLKVCIDVSYGIHYLHSFSDLEQRVTHSIIKSSSILLDSNLMAKIDAEYSNIDVPFEAESDYSDPSRDEIMVSDIYSFGIILFEVLCGRLAFDAEYDTNSQDLIQLAKKNYKDGKLEEIIDPFLRNQMATESLSTFSEIAYQCCNDDPKQRPTMDYIKMQLVESLKVQWAFEQLNCDAAFKNSSAAFGIVARDSVGLFRYVIGNRCRAVSPLHAEIIAVHSA
ncbi:receptor-like protein kinase HERK 1 [Tanacetum coccineum]